MFELCVVLWLKLTCRRVKGRLIVIKIWVSDTLLKKQNNSSKTTAEAVYLKPVPLKQASLGRPQAWSCKRSLLWGKALTYLLWQLAASSMVRHSSGLLKLCLRPQTSPYHVNFCPRDACSERFPSCECVLALHWAALSWVLHPQSFFVASRWRRSQVWACLTKPQRHLSFTRPQGCVTAIAEGTFCFCPGRAVL